VPYCDAALVNATTAASSARETEWVLTTSGTTGAPKLVAHTLRGLVGAIAPPDRGAQPSVWATFYDIRRYGGLQIFLRAIVGGASMVFSDANEPLDEQMRRLARCGVTHISGTPSRWRRALMSPERALIAPQYVRLSGEIADQALLNALKEAFRPAGGVPMLCVDRSRRRVQRYRRP
jgi:acyl-coenzyme A synthetase/AMP-(fatty) acid ligase